MGFFSDLGWGVGGGGKQKKTENNKSIKKSRFLNLFVLFCFKNSKNNKYFFFFFFFNISRTNSIIKLNFFMFFTLIFSDNFFVPNFIQLCSR